MFARHADHGSALMRAANPDGWITNEILLLRRIELGIRQIAWLNSEDGHKGRNHPEPMPLTVAEIDAATPESEKYDRMTIDEANAFLGWVSTDDGRVVIDRA